MNTFTEFNLDSNICKAIIACGYTKPTPVQSKSIPLVMNHQDVVVSAQTGTGKTAAFVLPALHNLSLSTGEKKTRVLILTPTRELASQIEKAARLYGKFMRFNIVSLVGGMPYHSQIRDLSRGADIIIATPGRLMDHIEQKRVDISKIDLLILDEADRMLDMGFIDDVQYIAKLTPSTRQTLLFSATLDNKLMNAVKHLLKNPVRIDLSHEKIAAPQIKQEMYRVTSIQHKARLLKQFLNDENIFKAIIFSATKINADRIADQLCDDGFSAAPLHGDLRQNQRNKTLDKFRDGRIQFLVATDVASRGIDVSDITHVFNYDLPRFCEDYVHRIGRTGRAGKTGIAISFVLPSDTRHVQAIERYTSQKVKFVQDPNGSADEGDNGSGRSGRGEGRREFRGERKEFGGERKFRSDRKPEFKKEFGEGRREFGGAPRRRDNDAGEGRREFGGAPRRRDNDAGESRREFGGAPRRRDNDAGEGKREFGGAPRRRDNDAGEGRREFGGAPRRRDDRGEVRREFRESTRPRDTDAAPRREVKESYHGKDGKEVKIAFKESNRRGSNDARSSSRGGREDSRRPGSDSGRFKDGYAKKKSFSSDRPDQASGERRSSRPFGGSDEKRDRFAKEDKSRSGFKKRSISKDGKFADKRKVVGE